MLREAADRMLGTPAKDWNARLHAAFNPALADVGKGKQSRAADKHSDALPSHPIDDYLGT